MNRPIAPATWTATLAVATPQHATGFRSDIEGLRAVSVAAVVLFHAYPDTLPGGFIGVDVFFVISGFLITRLLIRELAATGRIELADFWARRIRRILPAATFVLCATALIALMLPSVDARLLGRHIIAGSLFYYNWRQAGNAVDYLGQEDRGNPLLHYWSLAVEEQFYLVWPLLLTLVALFMRERAARNLRGPLVALIAVLAVASFAYCVCLTATDGPLAFFSTLTRSWQFLAGAMVAVISLRARPEGQPLAGAIGVACMLVLLASFVWISESIPYPGVAAAVPTLATALLLHYGASSDSWSSAALSAAPLRYVGRISFSWYLWHWPLIVFLGLASVEGGMLAGSTVPASLAIVLSFCLAAATYHHIEQPVRYSASLMASRRTTFVFGACLIATGVLTGLAMKWFAPDAVHIGHDVFISRAAIKDDRPVIYSDRCLLRHKDVNYAECVYGAAFGKKTVVLFGDSHAGNWFSALDIAAKKQGWRLLVRIKASCRPIEAPQVHADGRDYPECGKWRSIVLEELESASTQLIVVAGMSSRHLAVDEQKIFQRLANVAPTVAMRDTPVLPESPSNCLSRAEHPGDCVWHLKDFPSKNSYPKTAESKLPMGVEILDLNERVCPQSECRAVTVGRVLMTDKHHLTDSFSATLSDEFGKLLIQHTE